jgi:alkylated DNA repair dioxygenase AlkB
MHPPHDEAWRRVPLAGGEVSLLARLPLPVPLTAASLFDELVAATPWRQDRVRLFGREIAQPRLTAWYGDAGAHYRYSGLSLAPLPWTPTLALLRALVQDATGAAFDSCLLNLYRDGRDSIGWHADDEAALGPRPVIAALSLGAERALDFRPRRSAAGAASAASAAGGDEAGRVRVRVSLPAGSLLVMRGQTQRLWHHGIAKTACACGPRVSLTFRRVRVSAA